MDSLGDLQPAGFPRCPKCPLLVGGSAAVCYACASATLTRARNPCPVCGQEDGNNGRCRNRLCTDPDRSIDKIVAIAMKGGAVDATIKQLKYPPWVRGWAIIFGRLVFGYVEANANRDRTGLIVANPTYVGAGSDRAVRHTELVIEAAAREDTLNRWPWDVGEPRAIVKTGPSPRSAGSGLAAKIEAADALVDVLRVPNPQRTAGKGIIVYDDVCTTGVQLDRVARLLKGQGGATVVVGLVLARARWR
jgi:predicted amidophosphoribosyltransferase